MLLQDLQNPGLVKEQLPFLQQEGSNLTAIASYRALTHRIRPIVRLGTCNCISDG